LKTRTVIAECSVSIGRVWARDVPNSSANTEILPFLLITISQETDSMWLALWHKN
jgi:hypothetical protein